ncbi:MAG TPA: glycosyltransferase family 4 protein [Methylomirabilota bacterium]|nr:glycosyltransferase family 4 protein [Methylomirabilota bacterium]
MRVLTFTSLYPNNIWPNHGVFIKERVTHFAALPGCEVKVVAPVPYFPPLKINHRWRFSQVCRRAMVEGLEVHHPRYFMTPKVGMSLYGWLMFLSVLATVKNIHRQFDFDLIDAHYIYPDSFAAVLLGRVLGKPVVVSARGSDVNLFQEFPLIRRLLRYTFRSARKVIAVSQALKRKIVELGIGAEQIAVIPNGVDTRKFYPAPKPGARQRLGLPPNKKMLLSVGNLTVNKGGELLLRALRRLLDHMPEEDPYLILIGEGALRKELEKLVERLNLKGHVRLIGAIPHRELYLWYSAADVFCLASSREGWPNVILESLACGTPVVATAVGGVPEILRSDKVGMLTGRDEVEFAEKITRALNTPWRSDTIVQYAKKYTWEQTALSVFHVFETVSQERIRYEN